MARLSSEGELLAPASERSWLIKLTAEPGSEGTRSFKFPAPKSADLKVHYKRYQDADLVEVSPDLALAGLPLSSAPFWRWIALGTGGVAALGFFTFRRRQRSAAAAPKPAYSLPAVVTPFTTLQLLRDLSTDQRLAFTTEQREKLSQLVKDIEAFYFSRQRDAATAPNLDSIARDRIGRAQALAA